MRVLGLRRSASCPQDLAEFIAITGGILVGVYVLRAPAPGPQDLVGCAKNVDIILNASIS